MDRIFKVHQKAIEGLWRNKKEEKWRKNQKRFSVKIEGNG